MRKNEPRIGPGMIYYFPLDDSGLPSTQETDKSVLERWDMISFSWLKYLLGFSTGQHDKTRRRKYAPKR